MPSESGCKRTASVLSERDSTGRGRGIRTPDSLLPKQVRYQAAPYPDVGDACKPLKYKRELLHRQWRTERVYTAG